MAIFALAACTGLAYVRYQSGVDMSQFMTEEQLAQEQAQYYNQDGSYGQQYDANGNYIGTDQSQYNSGNYMNYDGDITMNQ